MKTHTIPIDQPSDQPSAQAVHLPSRSRLGKYLIEQKLITRDSLEVALIEQKQELADRPESRHAVELALGEIIAGLKTCPRDQLRSALARYLALPAADLDQLSLTDGDGHQPLKRALDLCRRCNLNAEQMLHLQFMPFALIDNCLSVAMSRPQDLDLLDQLQDRLPNDVTIAPHLVLCADISRTINRLKLRHDDPIYQVAQLGQKLERNTDSHQQNQILVQLVERIFEAALCDRASDIHFAPSEKALRIMFRIDGVLRMRYRVHLRFASAVSVRLKVLAKLDISESRLPQDGGFRIQINGMTCDVRLSTQPTQYGESLVLRVHGHDLSRGQLEKTGLPPESVACIRRTLDRPHGLILIAGPTGSGKSSTLYAMIKALNVREKNVVTLEDPIESALGEEIRQTAINSSIGLSFSHALRSTLRQDPDVVMIGEIRDNDTAQISLRMAMTGHLVLATVHCDSALNVHLRLRLLNLEPELFADQLVACLAQRLARVSCPHCSYLRTPDESDCQLLQIESVDMPEKVLDARGCEHCAHTGYQNRRPILELLEINPELADLIAGRACVSQLRQAARRAGFESIYQQTRKAVRAQLMTVNEAVRVAG